VSTEGFEIDFQAQPSRNLSIGGGLAYADAKVDKFIANPGAAQAVANGTTLPLAPKLKLALNASYRIELPSFDITPTLLFNYTDEQYSDLNEPAALRIPSYSTVDLLVAIADKNDRYRLTIVGRNLTDESFAALITSNGPAGAPRLQIPREADRYFGAEFRINFGR